MLMKLRDLHEGLFAEAESEKPRPEGLEKGDKVKLRSHLGLTTVLLYQTRVGAEIKYVSSGTIVELASAAGPLNCRVKYDGEKYWVKTLNVEKYKAKD